MQIRGIRVGLFAPPGKVFQDVSSSPMTGLVVEKGWDGMTAMSETCRADRRLKL